MEYLNTIEINKKKFLKYNKIKYQRFQQFVSNVNTKKVINSIPFLLSVNHKKFPGYIDGNVPIGIANYSLDEDTKRFIRGKFPATTVEIGNYTNPCIHMLAIMGSIGTIAYNKKSDFDYWVCIDQRDIPKLELNLFKKKVEAIQNWAMSEIKLPVHIFINDVEKVKHNIFAEDEEEAFGSTVGAVLKDEFLRSSIIISGKIPFWWVLPQFVDDTEYNRLFGKLPKEMVKHDFIDIGNLYEISKEDFLGAALFQIIKSLGNPFKSIIKIGLLEKYLSGPEDSPLMSQKVKINVLREKFDNTTLDSYLMMFKEVFDYYSARIEEKALLNMLKKNLYLKIDPQLSRYVGMKDKKNIPYKVVIMFQYVKEWKWNIQNIKDLDNFENWDFNKVMEFWDAVKKFMLLSYKNISEQFPTLKIENKVSESDFLLLSRKIKTHFKREPDKIEQFISFKDTPSEAVLYIEPVSRDVHNVEWRLYKRNTIEKNKFATTTLKVEKQLLKLLVWTSLNQIYDPSFSRVNIQSGYSRINQQHVISFLEESSNFFKEGIISIKNEYFLSSAFNLLNFLIINFDIENAEYIQTVHYLCHTSWGESFLKEYKREEDLAHVLYTVLKDGYKLKKNFDNYCALNTPDPYKKLYKRIISIFKEAYSVIVEGNKNLAARFIVQIGSKFVLYTRDNGNVEKDEFPNIFNLLASLTLKPKKQIICKFFSADPTFAPLTNVYNLAEKHSIAIAYEEKGNFVIIYIVNEMGNLFTFLKPLAVRDDYFIALFDFCQNIINRLNKMIKQSGGTSGEIKINQIKTDRFGKVTVHDETPKIRGQLILNADNRQSLAASVSRHKGDETYYNIIYPDRGSSGFVSFMNLGSVASALLQYRSKGVDAKPIIRDLVFDDLTRDEIDMGSTLYLLEKYKIESMLDKTMKKR